MCRWFAYIGQEPTLLEDVLIQPSHSLIRQIDAHYLPALHATYAPHASPGRTTTFTKASDAPGNPNVLTNMDGFGVAYYTSTQADFDGSTEGHRPCTYKSTRPPLNDLNLRSLCEHTSTNCLFAHIRAASGLTPVVETNNHPFTFGRYLFMHNGVLEKFPYTKIGILGKLSPKAYANVFGTTDSEHAAALFFTHLGDDWDALYSDEQLKTAMRATLRDITSLVAALPDSTGPPAHSSLNFAVTNATNLLAVRFSSTPDHEPPSLYYSTTAGPTLNRKYPDHPDGKEHELPNASSKAEEEHGKHAIVASEPCTYNAKQWTLVPRECFVSVGESMEVQVEEVGNL